MLVSRLPTETTLEILSYLRIPYIHALQLTSRSFDNFVRTNESYIYQYAAIHHRFAESSVGLEDAIKIWEKRRRGSMRGVWDWRGFCKRIYTLENTFEGSNVIPPTVQSFVGTGKDVHRFKIDEDLRLVISTHAEGGLTVTSLDTGEELFSLSRVYVRRYAHVEYSHGYMIFDRMQPSSLEVWRLETPDWNPYPEEEEPEDRVQWRTYAENGRIGTQYPIHPTQKFAVSHRSGFAKRSDNTFTHAPPPPRRTGDGHNEPEDGNNDPTPSTSRSGLKPKKLGAFYPFALLTTQGAPRAYRFMFPTVLIASEEEKEAYLIDIPSGATLTERIKLREYLGDPAGPPGGGGQGGGGGGGGGHHGFGHFNFNLGAGNDLFGMGGGLAGPAFHFQYNGGGPQHNNTVWEWSWQGGQGAPPVTALHTILPDTDVGADGDDGDDDDVDVDVDADQDQDQDQNEDDNANANVYPYPNFRLAVNGEQVHLDQDGHGQANGGLLQVTATPPPPEGAAGGDDDDDIHAIQAVAGIATGPAPQRRHHAVSIQGNLGDGHMLQVHVNHNGNVRFGSGPPPPPVAAGGPVPGPSAPGPSAPAAGGSSGAGASASASTSTTSSTTVVGGSGAGVGPAAVPVATAGGATAHQGVTIHHAVHIQEAQPHGHPLHFIPVGQGGQPAHAAVHFPPHVPHFIDPSIQYVELSPRHIFICTVRELHIIERLTRNRVYSVHTSLDSGYQITPIETENVDAEIYEADSLRRAIQFPSHTLPSNFRNPTTSRRTAVRAVPISDEVDEIEKKWKGKDREIDEDVEVKRKAKKYFGQSIPAFGEGSDRLLKRVMLLPPKALEEESPQDGVEPAQPQSSSEAAAVGDNSQQSRALVRYTGRDSFWIFTAVHVSPDGRHFVAITRRGMVYLVRDFEKLFEGTDTEEDEEQRFEEHVLRIDVRSPAVGLAYEFGRILVQTRNAVFLFNWDTTLHDVICPAPPPYGDFIPNITALELRPFSFSRVLPLVQCIQLTRTRAWICWAAGALRRFQPDARAKTKKDKGKGKGKGKKRARDDDSGPPQWRPRPGHFGRGNAAAMGDVMGGFNGPFNGGLNGGHLMTFSTVLQPGVTTLSFGGGGMTANMNGNAGVPEIVNANTEVDATLDADTDAPIAEEEESILFADFTDEESEPETEVDEAAEEEVRQRRLRIHGPTRVNTGVPGVINIPIHREEDLEAEFDSFEIDDSDDEQRERYNWLFGFMAHAKRTVSCMDFLPEASTKTKN